MKFSLARLIFALAGSSLLGAVDLTLSTRPAGRVTLWNGHDLAGWVVVLKDPQADASHAWSAGNGILHLAGKPVGFLKSEKTFSNYHLHAEWRWPAKTGNSGLLVHVHGANKVQPDALQCQIKDPHSGDLIGTAGFDFRPSTASHGNRFKGKMTTPSEKPPGQWNTYDVFCRGDTIEVFLNGIRQNEAHKLSTASGSIGLEVEGYPIDFRNVWLQPLPSQPK